MHWMSQRDASDRRESNRQADFARQGCLERQDEVPRWLAASTKKPVRQNGLLI